MLSQTMNADPRERLKDLYGFDFLNPPASADIEQHMEIGHQLLSIPDYRISKYLEHEHRAHILTVVDKMLARKEFSGLFQRGFTVHPDLQEAIRLDLKLSPEEKIQPVHAAWDCLMGLFTDIRQLNAPNCYAVSALIYATENHPYKFVSELISFLERGHVTALGGGTVPIWPLLEERLTHNSDLAFTLKSNRSIRLPALRHIADILGLKADKGALEGCRSLDDVLACLTDECGAADRLDFAKKLYHSFKYNTLAHMMLAVSEFVYINGCDASGYTPSCLKEGFLKVILQNDRQGS